MCIYAYTNKFLLNNARIYRNGTFILKRCFKFDSHFSSGEPLVTNIDNAKPFSIEIDATMKAIGNDF